MQTVNEIGDPSAVYAKNTGVTSVAGENVILDGVSCLGLKNIGITAICYSGSGTIKLYGSPDGINYFLVSTFASLAIAVGTTHQEAQAISNYFRATCTGVCVLDLYLHAVV